MKDNKDRILITADKILFFDMDGTLVDTNLANFLSYEKAIKIVLQEDPKLIYNPKKRINRDVLKSVLPNLTDTEIKKVIQVKESFKQFNKKNNQCMPVKYIEYELEENDLKFQEINY